MKRLPVIFLFLFDFLFSQTLSAQDNAEPTPSVQATDMQDTTIEMEPSFVVLNRYAWIDSVTTVRVWASKMRDTTIMIDPSFVVIHTYAESDSLANLYGGFASRRDSLVHAFQDSLRSIGAALMRTADMQDTTILLEPAFVVTEIYAARDLADAAKASRHASMALAASMQDTTIEIDPAFVVTDVYAKTDKYNAFRDSVWATLADAAKMQDTTVEMDPSFVVMPVYTARDKQDAATDSLLRPTLMQDTVILIDPSFVVRDLYPAKDALDALTDSLHLIRDSLTAIRDSVYADSVQRHWAGWKKYEIKPSLDYTMNSERVLKAKSKAALQYNIADFYLFLNGSPVKPENSAFDFFAAGCLAFNSDDTLLLNSGLGSKLGIGVGIKLYQEKFSGSLHANNRNEDVFKLSQDDSLYLKSINVSALTQSLRLRSDPAYGSDIMIGEFQATYKKFYQKNADGEDEEKKYTVKIIFRVRVSGGLNNRLK